jgi:TetR/AcrR family transcriptional regulator, cholesterol catabolism regulator
MRLSKARREHVTAMMKDTISDAVGTVLEEHGMNGLTMDRVAATAGLAKASLYNYFEDKDDLLRSVYAKLVEPFFQAIEEIAHKDLPAPKKLEMILRDSLERSDKHKGIIRLLAESHQEFYEIKSRTRPRLFELLVPIFEQGIEEGSFQPHNPRNTSHMFLGCLSELFEWQKYGASSEEAKSYVETLIGAVVQGFSII